MRLFLAAGLLGSAGWLRAAEGPLRVFIAGGDAQAETQTRGTLGALAASLASSAAAQCEVEILPPDGESLDLTKLRASDVAVFWVQARKLGPSGRESLRQFIEGGHGLVVLGAGADTWSDWPEFGREVLGVHFGGSFANGAPMRIINLFPHPIFAGVDRFETTQGLFRCEAGPDAQVIMEGIASEEAVPMGWVRRWGRGRIVGLVTAAPAQVGDTEFLRLLANAVRWAAARPIPDAETLVQRTSMANAFPGALAICFPAGPSLCYDTVRGGINYVWNGDFIDLHPWWTGRHGDPLRTFAARFSGEIIYRERDMTTAMHVGTKNDQSVYHFRGYRLRRNGSPELYYTVGGRDVTEGLEAVSDGLGVVRTFHVSAGAAPLWLKLSDDAAAEVAVGGAEREGNLVHFDSASGGEFSVTIRQRISPGP